MIGTHRRSWDSDHLRTAPERCLPVSIAVCLLFVGLENLLPVPVYRVLRLW
jgi:hypothetical protein